MERVLEPELMEDDEQARAYAEADFDEPNTQFIERLTTRLGSLPNEARVVDLGCGPGDIAIRLARAFPGWRVDGIDGSEAMLRHGREAAVRHGVQDRVRLVRGLIPSASLPADTYDIVLSNSLLHHLPDPQALWATVVRVGRCSTRVAVGDLFRPATRAAAARIVETYSGHEPEVLRRDFYNSLLAAFRIDEVRAQLDAADLVTLSVQAVSDRHLWVEGRLPAAGEALARVRSRGWAPPTSPLACGRPDAS